MLLCQRTRLDDKSIFLQRGQVFRKEGEKRRRKTGSLEEIRFFFTFPQLYHTFETYYWIRDLPDLAAGCLHVFVFVYFGII